MATRAKAKTFEEMLQQLQGIVGQLEKGEVTLEQSVALYEEGMACAQAMQKLLEDAKGRVAVLEKQQETWAELPMPERVE
nr:exodeoxyribonuclease VII small subunit [Maliibacterium massiliense]